MNTRLLLNLFLFFGLAVLVSLAIYEPGKNQASDIITISSLNTNTIQHLKIINSRQQTSEFIKNENLWFMTQPFSTSANQNRINKLLEILQAVSIAQYPMSSVDANQLQLDMPTLTLSLDNLTMEFGTTETLSGNRYLKIANTVHLITDRYSYLTHGDATNFVNTKLLPENAEITTLNLPNITLQKHKDDWLINGSEIATSTKKDVQNLLVNWYQANALLITKPKGQHDQQSPLITISIMDNNKPIQLIVNKTDDEIIFIRNDTGLRYHFSQELGQKLLLLKQPITQLPK